MEMDTFFVQWKTDAMHPLDETIYISKQQKQNQVYEKAQELLLYSGETQDIVHFSTVEAPVGTVLFYVVSYHSCGESHGSRFDSLELALTFDDVLTWFDAAFSEHAHDKDSCTLCKLKDGERRCFLRKQGIFACKKQVSFRTGNEFTTVSFKWVHVKNTNCISKKRKIDT